MCFVTVRASLWAQFFAPGRATFAAHLTAVVAFPVVWLLATAVLLGARPPVPSVVQFAHAVLFMAGAALVLAPSRILRPSRPSFRRIGGSVAAMLLPLAILATHLPPLAFRHTTTLALILTGAAVEEIVFRHLMPRRCTALLARRWTGAWTRLAGFGTAQVVFALCHAVPTVLAAGTSTPVLGLVRLTASGLLLQCVQLQFGTGAAIGAHAAVNVALVLGSYSPHDPPGWPSVASLLVGGLLLTAAADHSSRRVRAVTYTR
jgi:hypothetical protein